MEKEQGTALYKKKDIEGAASHFRKAVELETTNLLFRSNLVAALIELKKYDEAQKECNEAIEAFNNSDFTVRNVEHLAKIYAR